MRKNPMPSAGLPTSAKLTALLLLVSCVAPMNTAAAANYKCNDGRMLHVKYNADRAEVVVDGHAYALSRKASRLGTRFTSQSATLIIDGTFAAFVADDLYDLNGCQSGVDRPQG